MPYNSFGKSSEETLEPQVTSADPQERKLARRLRILRRINAAKKRQVEVEDEEEEGIPKTTSKTVLETQVSTCSNNMYDAVDEGIEAVTNIQVAGNAYEVQRREEETAVKNVRMQKLEEEAKIAKEKFDAINAKWEKISKLNDPLDLYEETERQKEKCQELLAMKDAVIHRLQEELKTADLRFLKDQDKQTAEINLLVQRINEQIKIMKKVFRTQLEIIEGAIDVERNELMEAFNKKWEISNRQREKEQVNNLESKMKSLEAHHQEMDDIMVSHQERYRGARISLETDIQFLQRELESLKAVCLLNKEKIDYNYQVLKKRDEENLLIKSQQKRRINKLQDIATTLRRQINEMTENSRAEIKRLRVEVINLYQKITDIEKKSRHFISVNEFKFNQVWKFNTEQANNLLRKIMAMDCVIFEQILGLEWSFPEEYTKYISGVQMNISDDVSEERNTDNKRLSFYDEFKTRSFKESLDLKKRHQLLVRHLLSIVADSTGFLVEDRLQELLRPYILPQKTLVYLDNIFSALDVKNLQDIEILTEILEPYIDCETCAEKKAPSALTAEGKDLQSSRASDTSVNRKGGKEFGILAQISDLVTQQKEMVHNVVSDMTHKDASSEEEAGLGTEEDESISIGNQLSVEEVDDYDRISEVNCPSINTKILFTVKSEEDVGFVATADHVQYQMPEQPVRKEAAPEHPNTGQPVDDKVTAHIEEEKKETSSCRGICNNPAHALSIEPVFVLKALREFVAKINGQGKSSVPLTLTEKLEQKHNLTEKKFLTEDVGSYWEGYRTLFASKQEKMWDAVLLALHKFHDVLQSRHDLNEETKQLKIQNQDLRRLLQHYTVSPQVKRDVSFSEDDFFPAIEKEESVCETDVGIDPVTLNLYKKVIH